MALTDLLDDDRALGEVVTPVLTVGITLIIGVIVLTSIISALPSSVPEFQSAYNQAINMLNSSMALAALIPLAIVAGGVLFYIRGGGGRGGVRRPPR